MCAHYYVVNRKMYWYHNEYCIVGTYLSWVVCCEPSKLYVIADCRKVRL